MNNLLKISLLSISILSIYIIASVGLEVIPTFKVSKNAVNINNVSLNLSYSYLAGLIFYFFISYLPKQIELQKIKPIIALKITDLTNQIESYIHTFNSQEDGVIKTITDAEIKTLFTTNSLLDQSFYASLTGGSMSNVDFINSTKMNIIKYVDGILIYKEYLEFPQIIALEEIKDHKFFHMFKIQDPVQAHKIYNHDVYKNECAREFCELVKSLRKL